MADRATKPAILILNQMAGPMTWELAEDMGEALGQVALFTGHPDTLQKCHSKVQLFAAAPYRRGSFAHRALSWLHYWLQALLWLWRWPKETPLLLFSNPPILCWLGWLLRTLRGTRYSVMVHDIYPDVLVRMSGFSERHPLIRLWRRLNRRAYERADVVMTLGEYMAGTLSRQFDPAQTKHGEIEVIYPWVDTDKIKPIPKEENWFAQKHNQVDKLTVMYSGNMGLGHDIETMLAAANYLHDQTSIQFMFIGAGPKWELIRKTLEAKMMANVFLLDWQPEDVISCSLAAADVALVSLETELEGLAVPSKLFSFLASGAALIVLTGEQNELSRIVHNYDCGWQFSPGNVNGLVDTLRMLQAEPEILAKTRKNCRSTAEAIGSQANSRKHLVPLLQTFV